MGIFGHMTANSPMKSEGGSPPDDGDDHGTTMRDTKEFMNSLEEDLKKFNTQMESQSSSLQPSSTSEEPHFTVDSSPTRRT